MTCGYTTIIITVINSGSHLNAETFPLLLSADSRASRPQHVDHITRKKNCPALLSAGNERISGSNFSLNLQLGVSPSGKQPRFSVSRQQLAPGFMSGQHGEKTPVYAKQQGLTGAYFPAQSTHTSFGLYHNSLAL